MPDAQNVYLTAAINVGGLLSQSDGVVEPSEIRQLKRYFNITAASFPQASRIFNYQVQQPERLEQVVATLLATFGQYAEARETFNLGIVTVATADGGLHEGEIDLILRLSKLLRVSETQIDRIFSAAGLKYEKDSQTKPSSESRASHLAVLGLSSDASDTQITNAYRALVRRYHPDALRAQSLPAGEIVRAEAFLREINCYYEWLTKSRSQPQRQSALPNFHPADV